MHVDYIIVGQGIAGSLLWHELSCKGKRAVVIDKGMGGTSSLVAAGIINPVTGRQMKLTWRAGELIRFAWDYYTSLGIKYKLTLMYPMALYRLMNDVFIRNEWDTLLLKPGYNHFLGEVTENTWPAVNAQYGLGLVRHAFRVDSVVLLSAIRNDIQSENLLLEENFDYSLLHFNEENVLYKDITAEKIVFCEGSKVCNNPFFGYLPLSYAKGEILRVRIDNPMPDAILNKNGYLLPLGRNEFFLGATYDRTHQDCIPTTNGLEELKMKLAGITSAPYHILNHEAGIRPTSKDRKPVLGAHPRYHNIFVFNGLGTKGYSQAPFFAKQLSEHIEYGKKICPEVNINRFKASQNGD